VFAKGIRVDSATFKDIHGSGQTIHGRFFYFKFLEGEDLRLSIVVPKNLKLKATGRNRLKRQTREIIKDLLSNKIAAHVLVFLKPAIIKANKEEVAKEFATLLKRV